MKSYHHHIGDFDKATRHLTRIERSIYRDLLELYYDTEQPLTLDYSVLCRRIIAITDIERTAVEQVLNEFFKETPSGWYHVRCEEEIDKYRANSTQKALAGKASAEKRRLKLEQVLNVRSTAVQNHKPITNNQEPENKTYTENHSTATPSVCVENRIDEKRNDVRVPYQDIVDAYNRILGASSTNSNGLAKCLKLTEGRKKQIKARWVSGEIDKLDDWESYFHCIKSLPVYKGWNGDYTGWRPDLDYLTGVRNGVPVCIKILEQIGGEK